MKTTKPRTPPGAFQRSYQKLNLAQKQAVNSIEGPVMVIAGPGTGKTEVVALRVAQILRKTQMRPGNVLCLTFSTSGTKAMRDRLREIIGPDAYGVTVETVHSFCNEIILQHPHVFEDFRALEQVSEIERLRTIRALMKELGPGSVLGKPSRENDRATAILNRISEMKREGIAASTLESLVPKYRLEIETTENGKERNTKTQAYKDDIRLVQQFEEFISLHHGYNEALHDAYRYDYEDMVLVVIDALKKHDWLLAGLQERYQYILVDEFQDLNGAQNRVIETLTTEPTPEHPPNLFTVGDDDQAIYRFQGASPQNMLGFIRRFPDATVITLTENYRSTQEILDAAAAVIANNEERLASRIGGIEKKLQSNRAAGRNIRNQKPAFTRFPSTDTERAGIVEILRNAHEEGVPWTGMAVLCRRNEELEPLFDTLLAAEIPTILTAKQDLLLHPEVRQTITILKAIEHINSDAALGAALGCECLGFHPADLGRVWVTLRRRNRGRKADEPYTTLRELLLEENDQFSMFGSPFIVLERLHAQKESLTLPDLVEQTFRETGLLPKKDDASADPRVIAGLHAFYNYVKDRSYEQKALTLRGLLHDLDQYLTERHLKLEYAVPHLVLDGVNLMTAHGAKGLEFELVVMAHVRHRNWGDSVKGSLLSLPDHLIFHIDRAVERRAKHEDERRLFYTAMTRAKERLFLTFGETYRSGDEMKNAEPGSFIAESGTTLNEVTVPADEVPAPIETLHKPALLLDNAFHTFLSERLRDFALSATALSAFLDDPQSFLWTHLLQMPVQTLPHFAYGSAVHAALEMWWRSEGKGNLVQTFEDMMNERELFTDAEREHYLRVGRLVLQQYEKEVEHEQPIVYATERGFFARFRDIPLTGIIDRIDLFERGGQNCRIIDYKTGRPRKTTVAVRKDSTLYRQLVFYKLLTDLSPGFTHTATLLTLDFVGDETDSRRVLDFEITESEVRELKELITIVWEKIIALDFTPLQVG